MNSATIEKLIDAMQDSKGVPASERSVVSVLGALDSAGEGKQEVVNHIIEDFALTQRVLKLANSAMYGPFGAGAASVSAALNVLDTDALTHLVLSTHLAPDEDIRADTNLSRTLFASELARSACASRAEDASIATLMYEIGRLMTGKFLPSETLAIEQLVANGMNQQNAATEVLGMSFQEIGVELATRWNLPNYILSSINGTGDPTLVSISRFSSSASGLVYDGRPDEVSRLLLDLDLPNVDKSRLSVLVSRKFDETRAIQDSQSRNSVDPPDGNLRNAIHHEKKRIIDEMANSLLPTLSAGLGATHCLLFMLTRAGDFRVRAGYGKNLAQINRQLKISAEFSPTAFHMAIKNKTEIAVDDISRLKSTALPLDYRQLLPDVRQFVLLPIANTRTSGLLYCDWETLRLVGLESIEAMRRVRDLFVPFFP